MTPQVFFHDGGLTIWHVLKHGTPLYFWYSTRPDHGSGNAVQQGQFDVRNLPADALGEDAERIRDLRLPIETLRQAHLMVILRAARLGLLPAAS